MAVTAKQVTEQALRLICHVTETGGIDKTREAVFYNSAPAYLTVLQHELSEKEQQPFTESIEKLSDYISLSDKTALEVMPSGLAMYFALLDRDSELYNHFSQCYNKSLAPSVRPDESAMVECYLGANDPMMG